MKNIELYKEPVGRDKKGSVDKNQKNNHQKFKRTYTKKGINFYGEENFGSDLQIRDRNQSAAADSPSRHKLKVNTIFDVLSSEDKEIKQ